MHHGYVFQKTKKNVKKHPCFELQKKLSPCIAVGVSPRWSMVAVATTYHRREVREAVDLLLLAGIEEERQ